MFLNKFTYFDLLKHRVVKVNLLLPFNSTSFQSYNFLPMKGTVLQVVTVLYLTIYFQFGHFQRR